MQLRFTLLDYTFDYLSSTVIDEPLGWADIKIKAVRDKKTHGLFFEEGSGTLEFIGDGYSVIIAAFEDSGAEANTEVLVELDCGNGYEEVYTGNLNYSKLKKLSGDYCSVSLPVEQIGCLQTFKNRYEQKIDLEATESIGGIALPTYSALGEVIPLPAKPIYFLDSGTATGGGGSDFFMLIAVVFFGVPGSSFTAPTFEIEKEDFQLFWGELLPTRVTGIDSFPNIPNYNGTLEYDAGSEECATGNIIIEFTIDVEWEVQTSIGIIGDLKGCIYRTTNGGTFVDQTFFGSQTINCTGAPSGTFTVSGTHTMAVTAGQRIWVGLYFDTTSGVDGQTNIILTPTEDYKVQIFAETICEDSIARAFLVHETLSRICEIITDDCFRVMSEYFGRTDSEPSSFAEDGCGGLASFMKGLHIRGAVMIDGSNPRFFTSFKEIFEGGLQPIYNIGMGFEEIGGETVLRVEDVGFFYEDDELFVLDNPKEINEEVDPQRIYSLINNGYDKWESEYTGGIDEIQTKREYKTELTSTETKLELVSKLIASTYAIEITRRVGNTTEDFTYDNDTFILILQRGYSGLQPESFDLTGNYDNLLSIDNLFNLRISPARNLLRWFKTIAASWWAEFNSTRKVLFSSGEGNFLAETQTDTDACFLETQEPLEYLGESQDIDNTRFKDLPTPIWQPLLIKTKYPLSWAQFKLIKQNKYKYITFTKDGDSYSGWIMEIDYSPVDGEANFILLKRYQ